MQFIFDFEEPCDGLDYVSCSRSAYRSPASQLHRLRSRGPAPRDTAPPAAAEPRAAKPRGRGLRCTSMTLA